MKNILSAALTVLFVFTGIQFASAQSIRLKDGSLDMLKAASKMNVAYDYSQMGVGKFETEGEYITQKKADYNKKESGRGETWEKAWKADRKNRFQPQFEELFNKYGGKLSLGDYPSAQYTLILKTTYTEPGFNIYVTRKNAVINAEVWIVETENPDNPLAKLSIIKSPGRTFGGNDYDTGERIQEAYAAAGKALGKFLSKAAGK